MLTSTLTQTLDARTEIVKAQRDGIIQVRICLVLGFRCSLKGQVKFSVMVPVRVRVMVPVMVMVRVMVPVMVRVVC